MLLKSIVVWIELAGLNGLRKLNNNVFMLCWKGAKEATLYAF